jgi:FkbM family methyltransferase
MNELIEFSLDTENAEKSFKLAQWYENQGHTSPAHCYYLKTSEITDDSVFSYQSLIRASFCYKAQGSRDTTEKILLENALVLLPERPEAYYFLSLFYERRKDWQNSYIYSTLGLQCYKDNIKNINLPEFKGKYMLIFQKAIAGWWWGRGMESRELLHSLVHEYWEEMDDSHKNSVEDNITRLGSGPEEVAFCPYTKEKHNELRFKFNNSHKIERNYSQILQDIFILSMTNGKENGTFLEIGGGDPFKGNNSALLENDFNWKGVSIEFNEKFVQNYRINRKAKLLHTNALELDYENLLKENFEGNVIDYLQLDIEPARNTYECMLKIPFDKYKFSIITYEHDYYVDISHSYREKSREFLASKGYVLVVNDLSPEGKSNFEDWWVHPDLIDKSILSKMTSVINGTQDVRDYMFPSTNTNLPVNLDSIDWGLFDIDDEETRITKEYVKSEIEHGIYTKFFNVEEGDVVFDIGCSVGPFALSILHKNPKEIHCFDPHKGLFESMKNNLGDYNNVILNCAAIGDKDESNLSLDSVFDFNDPESKKNIDVIKFKTYIDNNKIEKIDFLKIDCEGGEWSVFTSENYNWIKNNVSKIAGEFHFFNLDMKKSFISFRDLYLKNSKNLKVFLSNRYAEVEDIEPSIWNDDFVFNNLNYCNISFEYSNEEFMNYNVNSKQTSWIVDNFYENPDKVREFALNQEYEIGGIGRGYIGNRTHQQFLFPGLKEKFEIIMGKKIIKWEEHGMNGRFQYCWAGQPLVYHCDNQQWGGMLYLTPDAPFECGTTLYAHKKTRARTYYDDGWDVSWKNVPGDPHLDGTPFEPVDVLGNVYNRLVIFDASCIHSASGYFGTVKENCRLWQMFFFDTDI